MVLRVDLDTSEWDKFSRRLKRSLSLESIAEAEEAAALEFLQFFEDAPIPRDEGPLASSYNVDIDRSKGEVIFGFNKVYAAFQDSKGKSEIIIRPKTKQFLYVPISKRGKRHKEGRDPKTEGLIRGKDYVLKKSVRVRVKPYGSAVGPNQYFSGTLERKGEFLFQSLVRYLERSIKRASR